MSQEVFVEPDRINSTAVVIVDDKFTLRLVVTK